VQDYVRNSSRNIDSKMLSSNRLPGINSLLNSWVKFKYKMQHSIRLFGMHSPRNRRNINYNSKGCRGGEIVLMLQVLRIPL
jgi:hypothetical protein